ncbi:MAG: response regulator, partial [Acidobacteria bacterium]|nr:response regulator [Acidobacteriota bacterium]
MRKVVVVDNHPMMVKFMESLLEREGYAVRSAENGLAALDLLRADIPDFLFVDLIMPHIDGATLCKIVRRIPEYSGIKLIVLSAIAAEEEVPTDLDADLFIAKGPFAALGPLILEAIQKIESHETNKVLGIEKVYPREITRELLKVRQYFNLVLERMSEAILEVTQEGRIVFANRAAMDLFQKPCEILIGENLTHLLPQAYQQAFCEALDLSQSVNFMEAGDPWVLNETFVFVQVFPLVPLDTNQFMVIIKDVTEQIIREQQLREAEKFRAIGTLAAGVAHDFNNLLMAIQGNISLLQMDINPTHPHWARFASMEQQIHYGARLTQQLLGYARKGRYEMRKTDINRCIQDAVDSFQTTKNISVVKYLAPDLPPVKADASQINQVMLNLLINALDASGEQGQITITTQVVDQSALENPHFKALSGQYVEVAIADNGVGIKPELLEKIFDPFFTTKEMGRGTGLGLASVYGIVKGHQGYVTVESKLGNGSIFHLYFPVVPLNQSTDVEGPHAQPHKGKALLVDDSESFRKIGRDMLIALGYEVLVAANGKEAIQTCKNTAHDLQIAIL